MILCNVLTDPEDKISLLEHLRRTGIQTGEHYPLALFEQSALQHSSIEMAAPCVNATRFCHSELSLPIHPYLAEDEIDAVIDAVNSWGV